ncbi:MAG: acetate/propionate family kinase, partial [Solirubrobacteraceae bacterium]
MRVLVVNAGSSSLKLRLLSDDDELIAAHDLDAPQAHVEPGALAAALDGLGAVDAIGHRVVHGGEHFIGPARIDPEVVAALRALTELAPLHQPASLAGLDAVAAVLPGPPAVACFDTAFHAALPEVAATYALPGEWRARWPLRRYGFHGLSHAYASRRAAELLGRRGDDGLRLVTCHLGAGASLAAVRGGRSVDTTMGFTPASGLVMGTRTGDIDPGLVRFLVEAGGLTVESFHAMVNHESGLLGISETSPDLRDLLARQGEDVR